MSDHQPVLVVGQGPAGAATALFLARLGIEVVAVDRQPKSGLQIGESLPPDAAELLRQLGVWEDFNEAGHEKCYGNKSYWHGEQVQYHDFLQHPQGHGWHIDRSGFEHMLRRHVAASGAEVNLNTKILGLHGDGPWEVEMQSAGGPVQRRGFSYIVDATGRNSWVARHMGVDRLYEDRQLALVAFADIKEGFHDTTSLVETVGQGWWYSAQIPGQRMATAYFFQNEAHLRPRMTCEADWWALAAQAGPTLDRLRSSGFEMLEPARFVAADSGILERLTGKGWLAVGDAAMTYDPLASHGLMMSMVSGRDAAHAIQAAMGGQHDAFEAYGQRLYQAFMAYSELRAQFYSSVATK